MCRDVMEYQRDQEANPPRVAVLAPSINPALDLSDYIRKCRFFKTGELITEHIKNIPHTREYLAITTNELNVRFASMDARYHEEMRINEEDEVKARQS